MSFKFYVLIKQLLYEVLFRIFMFQQEQSEKEHNKGRYCAYTTGRDVLKRHAMKVIFSKPKSNLASPNYKKTPSTLPHSKGPVQRSPQKELNHSSRAATGADVTCPVGCNLMSFICRQTGNTPLVTVCLSVSFRNMCHINSFTLGGWLNTWGTGNQSEIRIRRLSGWNFKITWNRQNNIFVGVINIQCSLLTCSIKMTTVLTCKKKPNI